MVAGTFFVSAVLNKKSKMKRKIRSIIEFTLLCYNNHVTKNVPVIPAFLAVKRVRRLQELHEAFRGSHDKFDLNHCYRRNE